MSLRVLEPGLQTLVVDLGRPGTRSLGVPVGGAADLPEFYRLLQITEERNGFRLGRSLAYFERQYTALNAEEPGRMELYLARHQGEIQLRAQDVLEPGLIGRARLGTWPLHSEGRGQSAWRTHVGREHSGQNDHLPRHTPDCCRETGSSVDWQRG